MTSLLAQRLSALLMAVVAGLVATGFVENETPRVTIRGRVTIDGQPLMQGVIGFRAAEPSHLAAAASEVVDGYYEIHAERNLVPTLYAVSVTSLPCQPSPTSTGDSAPPLGPDGSAETVPCRYNSRSVLTVEIPKGGLHRIDFELRR